METEWTDESEYLPKWKVDISAGATSFAALKQVLKPVFEQFLGASDYRSVPIAAGGTGGWHYSVELTTPVEEQIAELRKRADKMEADLRAGKL